MRDALQRIAAPPAWSPGPAPATADARVSAHHAPPAPRSPGSSSRPPHAAGRRRADRRCCSTGRPSSRTVPVVSGARPRIDLRSVLFPRRSGRSPHQRPGRNRQVDVVSTQPAPYPALTAVKTERRAGSVMLTPDMILSLACASLCAWIDLIEPGAAADRLTAAGERVTRQRLLVANALAAAGRQVDGGAALPQPAPARAGDRARHRLPHARDARRRRRGPAPRARWPRLRPMSPACRRTITTSRATAAAGSRRSTRPTSRRSRSASRGSTGFEIDDARLDFYGRCARCAAEMRQPA